ncbi:MAG: biotin--[acetyl-CoA-carboxylase] ligase [Thaumarchaeota archaeon]|nr:biotin--[acetyl-CoA-carboxylase] ligase [Nitrososphaerota archaeon]
MTKPRWIQKLRLRLKELNFIKGPLHYYTVVTSTQSEASKLASAGGNEGTVIIARKQYEGRGRLKRKWRSDPGGLWMSIILKPKFYMGKTHLITLLASLSVVRSMDQLSISEASIEWPNDVLIGKSKAAGIISEAVFQGSELKHIILGIGLNVNNQISRFEGELLRDATSLREASGHLFKLDEVAFLILRNFEGLCAEAQQLNPVNLLSHVRNRMGTIGKDIVLTIEGKDLKTQATDLSPDGELTIKEKDGALRNIRPVDVEKLHQA